MKVTKLNSEKVAQWLLQCNHEDFNGPIDVIAENYVTLEEVYTQRMEERKKQNDYPDAGTLQITLLARSLYQHLNSQAKATLQARVLAYTKDNTHNAMA